jgi:hypothetical protein
MKVVSRPPIFSPSRVISANPRERHHRQRRFSGRYLLGDVRTGENTDSIGVGVPQNVGKDLGHGLKCPLLDTFRQVQHRKIRRYGTFRCRAQPGAIELRRHTDRHQIGAVQHFGQVVAGTQLGLQPDISQEQRVLVTVVDGARTTTCSRAQIMVG